VQGIDPETGHYFDDTRRYIDAIEWLSDADRQRIFEDNARAVYGRLSAQLERQRSNEGATA
jgi:4-oxalmesaconate hydratase